MCKWQKCGVFECGIPYETLTQTCLSIIYAYSHHQTIHVLLPVPFVCTGSVVWPSTCCEYYIMSASSLCIYESNHMKTTTKYNLQVSIRETRWKIALKNSMEAGTNELIFCYGPWNIIKRLPKLCTVCTLYFTVETQFTTWNIPVMGK